MNFPKSLLIYMVFNIFGTSGQELVSVYEASRTGSPAWAPSFSGLEYMPKTPPPSETPTNEPPSITTSGSSGQDSAATPSGQPPTFVRASVPTFTPTVAATSADTPTSPPQQSNYASLRTRSPAWTPSIADALETASTTAPPAMPDDEVVGGSGGISTPSGQPPTFVRTSAPTFTPTVAATIAVIPTSPPQQSNYASLRTRSPAWTPSVADALETVSTTAPPEMPDDEVVGGSGGISSSFDVCFPGDALVEVQNQGLRKMEQVKVGDMIRVDTSGNYEPIYSFGHYENHRRAEFLEFVTDGKMKLRITPNHLVYEQRQRKFLPASAIQVGDLFVLAVNGNGQKKDNHQSVTGIRTVQSTGLYAPFTPSGTIVVDHMVASSFVHLSQLPLFVASSSLVSPQWLAHTGEFPHRLVCHYLGRDCANESYDEYGMNYHWATVPLQFLNTLGKQSIFLQSCIVAAILLLLVVFWIVEQMMNSPCVLLLAFGMMARFLYATKAIGRSSAKKKELMIKK